MANYSNGHAINVRLGVRKTGKEMFDVIKEWSVETGESMSAILRRCVRADLEYRMRLEDFRKGVKRAGKKKAN